MTWVRYAGRVAVLVQELHVKARTTGPVCTLIYLKYRPYLHKKLYPLQASNQPYRYITHYTAMCNSTERKPWLAVGNIAPYIIRWTGRGVGAIVAR